MVPVAHKPPCGTSDGWRRLGSFSCNASLPPFQPITVSSAKGASQHLHPVPPHSHRSVCEPRFAEDAQVTCRQQSNFRSQRRDEIVVSLDQVCQRPFCSAQVEGDHFEAVLRHAVIREATASVSAC